MPIKTILIALGLAAGAGWLAWTFIPTAILAAIGALAIGAGVLAGVAFALLAALAAAMAS